MTFNPSWSPGISDPPPTPTGTSKLGCGSGWSPERTVGDVSWSPEGTARYDGKGWECFGILSHPPGVGGWSWHSCPGRSPELGLLPPPQALFDMHIRYWCPLQNSYLYRNLREDEGGKLLPSLSSLQPLPLAGTCREMPTLSALPHHSETCSFPSSPRGPCWEFLLCRKWLGLGASPHPPGASQPQPFLPISPALSSALPCTSSQAWSLAGCGIFASSLPSSLHLQEWS